MSQYFAVNVMTPDLALTFLKLKRRLQGPRPLSPHPLWDCDAEGLPSHSKWMRDLTAVLQITGLTYWYLHQGTGSIIISPRFSPECEGY